MHRSIVVAGLLAVVATASAAAQGRSIVLEISGGAGFTSVDVDKWGGGNVRNEEQMLTAVDMRGFFLSAGGFQFGAEAGYRYFLYYEVPFGTTTLYRDVDANRFGVVARRPLSRFMSVDIGTAMYQFGSFTDFGLSGALVAHIPLGAKLTLPVHFRTDFVMDSDAQIVAPALTAGLSYKVR
jgi:hypothetical protein